MAPDHRHTIGPLFGEIAIGLGLVSGTDVLDALCEQEDRRNRGRPAERLGEILVEKGRLTREDVALVMERVEQQARTLEIAGYHSLELVARDETTLRFRGVALGTRRMVQIRILRFRLADQREERDRFRRECRVLGRLDHPNVVKLLDSGDLEGIPYLVLEDVPGPDLRSYVEENGPLAAADALAIVGGVATGLSHAHSHAILHGALRPDSILLPRLGGPKVTDFTVLDWDPEDSSAQARRGRSPHYLSPEQARGGGWPTIRSDVYSLGAVLYFLLTGRPPFRGPYQEILRQHLRRPAPDPRVHVSNVPAPVVEFVLGMLEKQPARRPATMDEVAALAERLSGPAPAEPAVAAAPAPAEPSRLRRRRPV